MRDTVWNAEHRPHSRCEKKCWEKITEKVNEVGVGELRSEKSGRKNWVDLTSRTKKAEAERLLLILFLLLPITTRLFLCLVFLHRSTIRYQLHPMGHWLQ